MTSLPRGLDVPAGIHRQAPTLQELVAKAVCGQLGGGQFEGTDLAGLGT